MFHLSVRSTRFKIRRRAGFTMVEVLIAAALMVLAGSISMAMFTFTLRSNKAIRTNAFMARDTLHVARALKMYATSAEKFVIANGDVLQIFQNDGTESRMSYIASSDGNSIVWDPVYGSNGDREIMIGNVTPVNDATPVFEQVPSKTAIRLRFRVGDRFASSDNDAKTGVGFQSYVVDSVFARRNSAS